MKIRASYTSLFATIVLVAGQVSFGMELAPNTKSIPELSCEAPTIWEQSFNKIVVEAAAFDPENKNKVLLMLSEECWSYDLENKNLTQKIFTHEQNKTDFIRQNSVRPKQVGPYALDYDGKYMETSIMSMIMLGNRVTVYDTATKAPLYTIEHEKEIKFATFNPDATQLITVSHDNQVKVSTIKKPITLECNGTPIAINPDIACTSQFINKCINFPSSDKSSVFDFEFSAENFNQMVRLMVLVYKKKIDQIKKLLSNLDFSSLCTLAEMCDPLQITNENIHLTDIVCECIAHKYDPKKDQPRVKQLPPYCQNIIARHLAKPCITYIDNNRKPRLSIHVNSFSVTLSSDGERIVTGSYNNTAKIWSAKTGECLQTLTGHTGLVRAIAINSDGKIVVTGSWDHTAKIWNTKTGECLHTLTGHTSYVSAVAISSGGENIATGSYDKTIKIWDMKTGKCLHTLTGHTEVVSSIAISSDGKIMVTGSADKTAKIWNTKTGECLHTLGRHTSWVRCVAISSDGKIVVTGSDDKTAKIWNAQTGECLHTLTGHTDWVTAVAISSNGERVVTGSHDITAKIWHAKTGECLRTFTGHTFWVTAVAISSDGERVATGSWDDTAKIWDIDQTEKRELLNKLTIEQAEFLRDTIYSAVKTGKKFEPLPKGEEYKILMKIPPRAQAYLKDHVKIIAALPNLTSVQLPHQPPYKHEAVKIENEFTKEEEKREAIEAQVGAQNLSDFFNTPFINKIWLLTGLSIGSFATAAAALFCYYKYFKRVANIF